MKKPRRHRSWPDEKVEKLRQMRMAGSTYAECAEALGVTITAAVEKARRMGFQQPTWRRKRKANRATQIVYKAPRKARKKLAPNETCANGHKLTAKLIGEYPRSATGKVNRYCRVCLALRNRLTRFDAKMAEQFAAMTAG